MIRRAVAALLALSLPLLLAAAPARAGDDARFDVDVQILANLSVEVDGAASSTYTATWDASSGGQRLASASTATVTNDSGGLTERWALSTNAQTINVGGGADVWTLAASTSAVGADQIGVQAVFGSSRTATCPAAAASDWDQAYAPPLTGAPAQYKAARFADPNLNDHGSYAPDLTSGFFDGLVFAGSRRALCWRLVLPAMTSTVQTQNIQITVTAVLP